MSSSGRALLFVVFLLHAVPAVAAAQWFGGVYLGGNYTQQSDVHIDQPSQETALTFEDVKFAARPLTSPQYYGGRIGRMFGSTSRLGVELEFIHLKVIARTANTSRVTGRLQGTPVEATTPMEEHVQRYAMTHGLNFLLANLVTQAPLGSGRRVALVGRLGGGPTLPHAESTVAGVPREQYEYAGMGLHASAGLDIRLRRRLSAMVEYKFTAARPEIRIHDGIGRTNAVSHHLAVGLAFGVPR